MGKRGPGVGESIWKGTNATIVWLLSTLGAKKVIQSANDKEVGWDEKTKETVAQRSRASVQNQG